MAGVPFDLLPKPENCIRQKMRCTGAQGNNCPAPSQLLSVFDHSKSGGWLED
ncbi:hypothetical protein M408DRAFT_300655 [Serendipita vermifera MAFF 305830]|uniref:Uncharacterized protein n=1 Tax=Serendipita vermifera MAFF 305830 TaxID=933852 RepID=A0A0C3AAY6_SERVB|nr:hypothetical protein M408DRAFT_300655 [Serendipita vermifera MAFF 305830]